MCSCISAVSAAHDDDDKARGVVHVVIRKTAAAGAHRSSHTSSARLKQWSWPPSNCRESKRLIDGVGSPVARTVNVAEWPSVKDMAGTVVKDGGVPTVSWKFWLAPPTSFYPLTLKAVPVPDVVTVNSLARSMVNFGYGSSTLARLWLDK